MKALTRLVPVAAVAAAAVAFTAPAAFAATTSAAGHESGDSGAVFALSDNTAVNTVAAYHRAADGTLTPAGTYVTGGRGGVLPGSVVDHTASQGCSRTTRPTGC